jgi:hypothetical protein
MKPSFWTKYKYRIGQFGNQFDKLVENGEDISEYTRLAKQHDVRQPFIKEDILDALMVVNNCHSYRALSKHINNFWCSPYTIETWLRSHPTFNVYAKNTKLGLTAQNREKQVIFSKRVRNRWGLPPGKFLWIHSDEKSGTRWSSDVGLRIIIACSWAKKNLVLYRSCASSLD